MADLATEIANLNAQAAELLAKYNGAFDRLDEETQNKILELQNKAQELQTQIESLGFKFDDNGILVKEDGSEISVGNALKLGGKSLEEVKIFAVAFLSGPYSYNAQYKNNWKNAHCFINGDNIGDTTNEYFEFIKDGDYYTGIKVLKDGIYECWYVQRGSGADNSEYGVVSLDGDRGSLENRYGDSVGPWMHDHSGGDQNYSKSFFFGKLNAGDIISGGSDSNADGYMQWGKETYIGQLCVKLVKEL